MIIFLIFSQFCRACGKVSVSSLPALQQWGQSLYKPEDMRNFCQTHSPHLYDTLLSSITRQDGRATSKNHTTLQEQRIVGLLHTLAYFRYLNQVHAYSKSYCLPNQLLTLKLNCTSPENTSFSILPLSRKLYTTRL